MNKYGWHLDGEEHVRGRVWWVLGRMGDANTLKDAMAQAEAKLDQIAEKQGAK